MIGKDTRVSGYMLESALQAGFIAAGVNVSLCGPLPTPGVAYLTKSLRRKFGVVISASHNDFLDNGIKIFNADGEKLSRDLEKKIEKLLETDLNPVSTEELGKARRFDESGEVYWFSNQQYLKKFHLYLKNYLECKWRMLQNKPRCF